MNPFRVATTPDELRPDADIQRTGLRLRASFFQFARELSLSVPKRGDHYRVLLDLKQQRFGLKKAPKGAKAERGLQFSGTAFNNCKIHARIEEAFGPQWDEPTLSLVIPEPGEGVDFCFERYDVVIDRVRKIYRDTPALVQGFGFRPCEGGVFLGDEHTLLLGGGRLTAMRNGVEVSCMRLCVPFLKHGDVERFLAGLVGAPVSQAK